MPVTNYLWDDDNIVLEYDDEGATMAEYTYEPQQYGNLISERRDGVTYHHHYDALGSTRMLTDEDGQITDTFEYDAWGNELSRTGTTETPFRWVGEIGCYFDMKVFSVAIRSRVYSPQVSRWTSPDALRFIDGPNGYIYALNRPISLIDPFGLYWISNEDPPELDALQWSPGDLRRWWNRGRRTVRLNEQTSAEITSKAEGKCRACCLAVNGQDRFAYVRRVDVDWWWLNDQDAGWRFNSGWRVVTYRGTSPWSVSRTPEHQRYGQYVRTATRVDRRDRYGFEYNHRMHEYECYCNVFRPCRTFPVPTQCNGDYYVYAYTEFDLEHTTQDREVPVFQYSNRGP